MVWAAEIAEMSGGQIPAQSRDDAGALPRDELASA